MSTCGWAPPMSTRSRFGGRSEKLTLVKQSELCPFYLRGISLIGELIKQGRRQDIFHIP